MTRLCRLTPAICAFHLGFSLVLFPDGLVDTGKSPPTPDSRLLWNDGQVKRVSGIRHIQVETVLGESDAGGIWSTLVHHPALLQRGEPQPQRERQHHRCRIPHGRPRLQIVAVGRGRVSAWRSTSSRPIHRQRSSRETMISKAQIPEGCEWDGCTLSISRVIRPVIYTDIRPPWGVVVR